MIYEYTDAYQEDHSAAVMPFLSTINNKR